MAALAPMRQVRWAEHFGWTFGHCACLPGRSVRVCRGVARWRAARHSSRCPLSPHQSSTQKAGVFRGNRSGISQSALPRISVRSSSTVVRAAAEDAAPPAQPTAFKAPPTVSWPRDTETARDVFSFAGPLPEVSFVCVCVSRILRGGWLGAPSIARRAQCRRRRRRR
jgi:hypothetical protein